MLHPVELVKWLGMHLNLSPRHPLNERAFWSLYTLDAQVLEQAPAGLAVGTDLLVVVTTFQRPRACAQLLQSLRAALDEDPARGRVHLLVLNDCGSADYAPVRQLARALFPDSVSWLDARERLGKPGFWKTFQTAFLAARASSTSHALFLQDDVEFAPTMLRDAFACWEHVREHQRRVLYLFSDTSDPTNGRWTYFKRVEVGRGVRLTKWFDLQAFLVDRAFFELLHYWVIPVHPNRWRRKPSLSSGVGQQFTLRLRHRANVYQTHPPLVFHGGWESQMNKAARAREPLDNRALRDRPPSDGNGSPPSS